jgi:hypothetical protein
MSRFLIENQVIPEPYYFQYLPIASTPAQKPLSLPSPFFIANRVHLKFDKKVI